MKENVEEMNLGYTVNTCGNVTMKTPMYKKYMLIKYLKKR
jgi:hypothetical protein